MKATRDLKTESRNTAEPFDKVTPRPAELYINTETLKPAVGGLLKHLQVDLTVMTAQRKTGQRLRRRTETENKKERKGKERCVQVA